MQMPVMLIITATAPTSSNIPIQILFGGTNELPDTERWAPHCWSLVYHDGGKWYFDIKRYGEIVLQQEEQQKRRALQEGKEEVVVAVGRTKNSTSTQIRKIFFSVWRSIKYSLILIEIKNDWFNFTTCSQSSIDGLENLKAPNRH